MREISFLHRLGTRLTLLILVVVAVLAGATAILLVRGVRLAERSAVEQMLPGSGEGFGLPGQPGVGGGPEGAGNSSDVGAVVRATMINLIAIFLFTLVGAAVFSRGLLTEPITALVRATRELAGGNLGVTLPVTSKSELGLLAEAFNTMSLRLADRTRDLLSSNEALRVSEARYELAMRGANDGLWDWDVTSGSLYLSPRWKAMLGYGPDDLGEQDRGLDAWRALVHPDDEADFGARLGAHLAGQETGFQLEQRLRHQDGGYRWVLVRGASLRDAGGRPLRVAGSITDISDRVQALTLLEQRVQERTAALQALLELGNSTALTLELHPLLERILLRLEETVGFRGAAVLERSGDELVPLAARGTKTQQDGAAAREAARAAVAAGKLQLARDGKLAALPLVVREVTVGALVLLFDAPLPEERLPLAVAFANQVAVALENARLYQQVQEQAAFEERQHLARELHDSVSQALYGILLGTHAAIKQLGLDREDGHGDASAPTTAVREPLRYVEGLAQAAIAEMRALIFELRPESLEKEGLVGVLRKQLDAMESRHQLDSRLLVDGEPEVPFATKQVLFRVAQEALHNVVKHASARQVVVELHQGGNRVTLEIRDDGVGFDPSQAFPGHLGLESMAERVSQLGGNLDITSSPGQGVIVTAVVPSEALGDPVSATGGEPTGGEPTGGEPM